MENPYWKALFTERTECDSKKIRPERKGGATWADDLELNRGANRGANREAGLITSDYGSDGLVFLKFALRAQEMGK